MSRWLFSQQNPGEPSQLPFALNLLKQAGRHGFKIFGGGAYWCNRLKLAGGRCRDHRARQRHGKAKAQPGDDKTAESALRREHNCHTPRTPWRAAALTHDVLAGSASSIQKAAPAGRAQFFWTGQRGKRQSPTPARRGQSSTMKMLYSSISQRQSRRCHCADVVRPLYQRPFAPRRRDRRAPRLPRVFGADIRRRCRAGELLRKPPSILRAWREAVASRGQVPSHVVKTIRAKYFERQ